jgi:MoaD family protein
MEVRFYATFRPIVGGKTQHFELAPGATASTLLKATVERYPDMATRIWDAAGGLSEHVKVFVNGREIVHMQGLDTPVPADAEVDIFPPTAGG